jgi:hypothetical protein
MVIVVALHTALLLVVALEKITLDIPSAVGLDIDLSMALPSAQPVALPIAPAIAKTIQN